MAFFLLRCRFVQSWSQLLPVFTIKLNKVLSTRDSNQMLIYTLIKRCILFHFIFYIFFCFTNNFKTFFYFCVYLSVSFFCFKWSTDPHQIPLWSFPFVKDQSAPSYYWLQFAQKKKRKSLFHLIPRYTQNTQTDVLALADRFIFAENRSGHSLTGFQHVWLNWERFAICSPWMFSFNVSKFSGLNFSRLIVKKHAAFKCVRPWNGSLFYQSVSTDSPPPCHHESIFS